jgi:hypothetical protein
LHYRCIALFAAVFISATIIQQACLYLKQTRISYASLNFLIEDITMHKQVLAATLSGLCLFGAISCQQKNDATTEKNPIQTSIITSEAEQKNTLKKLELAAASSVSSQGFSLAITHDTAITNNPSIPKDVHGLPTPQNDTHGMAPSTAPMPKAPSPINPSQIPNTTDPLEDKQPEQDSSIAPAPNTMSPENNNAAPTLQGPAQVGKPAAAIAPT